MDIQESAGRAHFYTHTGGPPPRPVRNDTKKKHLSLDVEIAQQHALVEAENNPLHRDVVNLHFLSKTQQIVRERINSSKDLSMIDLSKCNLSKIPSIIFNPESTFHECLTELNLSHNKLTHLPNSICLLSRLIVLDCSFNEITDLPGELADLSELQHLNLAGNPLLPGLKKLLLLGTVQVLQHLRENKPKLLPSRSGSLRRRNALREMFAHSPISQPAKTLPPKSPTHKTDHPVQLPPPPPSEPSSPPAPLADPLIAQMKLGLEASIGLSTTNIVANNKFKSLLMDGRGSQFKFTTYCNSQFAELRDMAGIDTEKFRSSLSSVTALGFSGKSGSVLLRSADNLLVLKTIKSDESRYLRRMLSQYVEYMKRNPNTVLTRFWGLYKVIRSPVEKISFIVMKNAFSSGNKIHERYDLKGSRVGRHSGEENLRRSRVMLKDLDLCQMNRRIRLGPHRKQFLEQIASDSKFLEKFEIIDYSLILGIHYLADFDPTTPTTPPATPEVGHDDGDGELDDAQREAQQTAAQSQSHPDQLYGAVLGRTDKGESVGEIYYMNIIDMLQPYNFRKQLEYGVKSIKYGDDISVIPPGQYSNRFISFLTAVAD